MVEALYAYFFLGPIGSFPVETSAAGLPGTRNFAAVYTKGHFRQHLRGFVHVGHPSKKSRFCPLGSKQKAKATPHASFGPSKRSKE